MPGSRTAGALHEYVNWKSPELTSSSHFPFVPDRREDHHLPPEEYQRWDAQGREWPTSHRAARDYERGFLSEGWQRRWEHSGPTCYNREVSAKKRDSSYRELEAWAARYSHSLPRKRQMEELRGACKAPVESSRSLERGGADLRVQHASGLWDRQGRRTTKYNPYQPTGSDTKENFQRRMFSQPPGYIAPPPYNNPQKSSGLAYQKATSWEQGDKSHAFWTQHTLKSQDVSVDSDHKQKRDKEEVTKPEADETFTELKQQKSDESSLKAVSSTDSKHTNTHSEQMLPQQHSLAHSPQMSQELPSKVIEGRKFRLNRKTGRMTIFCLVSRIASATETQSLPLCVSHENKQSSGKESDIPVVDQTPKVSDEVDFTAPALTERSEAAQMETLIPAEKDTASIERAEAGEEESGRSAQPVAVKYPLWREPSFINRTEAESFCSLTATKNENPDLEQRDAAKVRDEETDAEQKHKDTEDDKGLLVIDTTCVVVKVQMIPSLKKEHVHYLAGNPQMTAASDDATTDENTEDIPLKTSLLCEADPTSVLMEDEHKDESQGSFSCVKPSASPEADESAESRTQSPLPVCIPEQQQEDGSNVEDPEKPEPSQSKQPSEDTTVEHFSEDPRVQQPQEKIIAEESGEDTMDRQPANHQTLEKPLEKIQTEDEQFPDDPADGKVSEDHVEEEQSLETQDSIKQQRIDEDSEDLVECQERAADASEEIKTDSHLETDRESLAEPEMSEDLQLEITSEECTNEQTQNETESSQLSDQSSSTTGSEVSVCEGSASELTPIPFPVTPPSCDVSTLQEDHLLSPSPPIDITAEVSSEEDKISNLPEEEVNGESSGADASEEEVFQHQTEPQKSVCAAGVTDNQQTNQKTDRFEASNADSNVPLQTSEYDLTESDASVKPNEKLNDDPAEQNCISHEEEASSEQSRVNTLQQQEEDEVYIKEQSQTESCQLVEELWLQKPDVSKDDVNSDSSTLFEESASNEPPSSPRGPCESEAEVIPLDENLVCSQAEEDLQLLSSSLSSSPHLQSLSSAPPQDGTTSPGSPPSADEKEPEYPESLWDVVNRIRKHTAPDSENEEDAASESWDLENAGDNLGPVSSEIFSAPQEVSHVEVEDAHEENMKNVDEDALSSCSTGSNVSDDTVIVAEEEKTAEEQ